LWKSAVAHIPKHRSFGTEISRGQFSVSEKLQELLGLIIHLLTFRRLSLSCLAGFDVLALLIDFSPFGLEILFRKRLLCFALRGKIYAVFSSVSLPFFFYETPVRSRHFGEFGFDLFFAVGLRPRRNSLFVLLHESSDVFDERCGKL
jgi:hypothetical protein